MKKLFLLGVILFLTITMNAQGNMQFNQVKHLTFSGKTVSRTNTIISTVTVLENKVWKVESGSIWNLSEGPYYYNLTIDNQLIQSNLGGLSSPISLPIWLGSGTYNISYTFFNSVSTGTVYDYRAALSILEFNIVP